MASYQPPYTSGFGPPPPPGWGQPPLQQHMYGQAAPYQQAPPAPSASGPPIKKLKGNPVITKYPPPPPGWKPPFQASGYQPPVAGYEQHQYTAPVPGGYPFPQPPQPPVSHYQPPVSYPQPAYQQPIYQGDANQAYQQPPYPGGQDYAYQQQSYPVEPHQVYQQPPYQPLVQPYAASSAAAQPDQPQPQSGYYDVHGAWQTSQPPYIAPLPQHSAVPQAASLPMNGAPSEPDHARTRQQSIDDSIMDLDFEAESTTLTDEIDPRFSLGIITWHPAIEKTRPLPSTFNEAELEDIAPAKSEKDEHTCISKYHVKSKAHESELSVKQTEDWDKVKDDLIFVEFVETCEIVPLWTVIENRNRPESSLEAEKAVQPGSMDLDPEGEQEQLPPTKQPAQLSEPTPPVQRERNHMIAQASQTKLPGPTQATIGDSQAQGHGGDESDGDQAMDMSSDDEEAEPAKPVSKPNLPKKVVSVTKATYARQQPTTMTSHKPPYNKQNNILDSLERALSPRDHPSLPPKPSRPPPSARHSRSRSPDKMNRSRQGSQQPKPKPLSLSRDATQESILAALGVSGSPKTVYPTPPPALGAPASPDRARSPERFHQPLQGRAQPFGLPYGPHFPPPPPPREARSPSLDPWKAHDAIHGNYFRDRSPSTTSQVTAAGSDFHADDHKDMDATPKAKAPPPATSQDRQGGPDSGRKRTYERFTEPDGDRRRRQPDDTPRARRKPNYDRTDAYSRRW